MFHWYIHYMILNFPSWYITQRVNLSKYLSFYILSLSSIDSIVWFIYDHIINVHAIVRHRTDTLRKLTLTPYIVRSWIPYLLWFIPQWSYLGTPKCKYLDRYLLRPLTNKLKISRIWPRGLYPLRIKINSHMTI